jgi:hypothetical protein
MERETSQLRTRVRVAHHRTSKGWTFEDTVEVEMPYPDNPEAVPDADAALQYRLTELLEEVWLTASNETNRRNMRDGFLHPNGSQRT